MGEEVAELGVVGGEGGELFCEEGERAGEDGGAGVDLGGCVGYADEGWGRRRRRRKVEDKLEKGVKLEEEKKRKS